MKGIAGLTLVIALAAADSRAAADDRLNLLFILTDNQAPWTLGAYGNRDIRTPNVDRLAAAGMLFRNAFAVNPVCSPNRATLLTGLMPSQHGVHSYLRVDDGIQVGPKAYCTIAEFRSLPELLTEAGRTCGLKWHLGDSLRPHEGFSYWYTIPYGSSTFYNAKVVWQGALRGEARYLTDAITDHALEFLEQNKERPFFLYLAYNGPYGLGPAFREPHRNRHTEYYAGQTLLSFPREPAHPWLFNNREFLNNPVAIRGYAAAISGVDDGVGRVLEALQRHSLERKTLVVFAGDQGLAGGHHGVWGMGDHTRPDHTFDEGMRVPLIYRLPGRIPAGRVSDALVTNCDFFPTVLAFLGLGDRVPAAPAPPGRSYAGVLDGGKPAWDDVVFYEFETKRVIRTAQWKYIRRHPAGPDELYDLVHTPGERTNFIHHPDYAEVQKRLLERLQTFFARYADSRYDLLRGGSSKAPRLLH